jgi:hypothetical protein
MSLEFPKPNPADESWERLRSCNVLVISDRRSDGGLVVVDLRPSHESSQQLMTVGFSEVLSEEEMEVFPKRRGEDVDMGALFNTIKKATGGAFNLLAQMRPELAFPDEETILNILTPIEDLARSSAWRPILDVIAENVDVGPLQEIAVIRIRNAQRGLILGDPFEYRTFWQRER